MDDVIAISFDGFSLNSAPYKVSEVDPYGSPMKNTKTYGLARQHGSKRVFEKYESKSIVISGEIICASRLELEQSLDALKKQLRRQQGLLRVGYTDGYRQWVCTAKNVAVKRSRQHISYAPFSIEFECESPFATDGVTDTLIDNETITDNSAIFSIAVNGTMDAAPQITMLLNDVDPDDEIRELVIGNSATSQYLTISRIFTTGESISIDCDNQRVFIDGELIKVDGQFPEWSAGNGTLEYTDSMDDRDISITMTAERRYL